MSAACTFLYPPCASKSTENDRTSASICLGGRRKTQAVTAKQGVLEVQTTMKQACKLHVLGTGAHRGGNHDNRKRTVP